MYKPLSSEQLESLHNTAVQVLETIGVRVSTQEALRIFKNHGALIDEQSRIVKIPERIIKHALRSAPHDVTLGARDKKHSLSLKQGRMYTRPSTGYNDVIDFETGSARSGLSHDTTIASQLIEDLENVSMNATHVFPSDALPHVKDVQSFRLALENCQKHVVTSPLSKDTLEFQYRISTVFEKESDAASPIFSSLVCPIAPLQLRDEVTVFCAKKRIPAIIVSGVAVGAASPITLAGTLVQQSAESLATITLMQLASPGCAVILGNKTAPLDQRYLTPLSGVVEIGMLSAACIQVAEYYGIPGEGFGLRTDSKTIDEQSGVERVLVGLLPALAGARIDSGAGSIEAINTFSMEQLVIDDEIYGMIQRLLRGIDFDEETLAFKEIAAVGIGGNFLGRQHTRKYYRKEFYQHKLFDKRIRKDWEDAGRKDIREIARDRVRKLISDHKPAPALGNDARAEVAKIFSEAEGQVSAS